MNPVEAIAHRWLGSAFESKVLYEPDGNVPPDFLVDSRIAVEVRRLNQLWHNGSKHEGLEEAEHRLIQGITSELDSFGLRKGDKSLFVFVRFSRPVEAWKTLRPKVQRALLRLSNHAGPGMMKVKVTDRLELDVMEASEPQDEQFLLGGYSDREAGGWVAAELINSVRTIIDEKARKIRRVRHRYDEWWLLLVDRTGFGFKESDGAVLASADLQTEPWSRVVVLDSRGENVIAQI